MTNLIRLYKEESKDWGTTQNLYTEGDNLEVLKLLQKSYHSKVKMVYIDIITMKTIQFSYLKGYYTIIPRGVQTQKRVCS